MSVRPRQPGAFAAAVQWPTLPAVVARHVEEAAQLRLVRSVFVRAPQVKLRQLGRLDERIAAQLDGIAIAGEQGASLAQQALEAPGKGEVFVATVRAIEDRDGRRLDHLLAVVEALPASRPGLLSAFGWVSAAHLRGTIKALLASAEPWRRDIGLATCALHAVDPGLALMRALRDPDADLRARALRGAARLGRRDLLETCLAALADEDAVCAFEAARSALLLGDRGAALEALEALALDPQAGAQRRLAASSIVLRIEAPRRARWMLARLARDPALLRLLIRGIAAAGDPHYMPWLIAQTETPQLARLAGEAFSLIAGLDLAKRELERKAPEDLLGGPNDDPDDDDVGMDEDDGLPWPDPAKLGAWWKAHAAGFAAGTRHFMGQPPSTAHCVEVLKSGAQRQRIAAAEMLCLLSPGTPLFNTSASTRRQLRLLATMVG